MRVLTHVFAGAGTVDYQIPGKYLRLIQTAAAVDIVPLDGMREIESEKGFGVEAGYATRPPGGFDGVRITASGAQTVRFAISNGSGDYNRLSGDVNILSSSVTLPVSIAGTVNVTGPLTDAQLRASNVAVSDYCFLPSSVSSQTTFAANTAQLVTGFAAANNTNGAIIYAAQGSMFNTGGIAPAFALIAKATAPANVTDGFVIASPVNAIAFNSLYGAYIDFKSPIRIPSGLGLYWIATAAESVVGTRTVVFKLL